MPGTDSQVDRFASRPTSTGRVVGLASDGKHRFSKSARNSLTFLKGIGVEDDAHAGLFVRHRYLARRSPRMPNLRQVYLIRFELLEELRTADFDLSPGDLGENVLTAGIKLESLPLGTTLKFRNATVVEITGLRTPCVLIERFKSGLKQRLVNSGSGDPPFRCGVMGIVRLGGQVTVGDHIEVKFPRKPWTSLPAL
jgi:MOSC domain